jgi:hypothetical protein
MQRILLSSVATAALLASGAALATEVNVDVSQTFENIQLGGNLLNVLHNNTDVEQTVTNLANGIIDERGNDGDWDDLDQYFGGLQVSGNVAVTEYGQWNDLTQEATNVANLVNVDDVDTIWQNAEGFQFSVNYAEYGQWVDEAAQSASNLANVVEIDDGDKIKQFAFINQAAINALHYDGVAEATGGNCYQDRNGDVAELVQEATNVANLLNAGDVEDVYQDADIDQVALNLASFGKGISDSSQTATNVANLAQFEELDGDIDQIAEGESQKAANVLAASVSGGAMGDYLTGTIENVSQTSSNLQNVIIAGDIDGHHGVTEVVQQSYTPQMAGNIALGSGFTNNLTQGATNVSNLVTVTVE